MSGLTWLHLSDWHQEGKAFDRKVVRDKLIDDIKARSSIHPDLEKIDFIVFSGDLAYHGLIEEFEAAKEIFLEPVREAADVSKDRFFIVPGNHDMDRGLFEYLPEALKKPLTTHKAITEWLDNERGQKKILELFEAYSQFVHDYAGDHLSGYTCNKDMEKDGKTVALMGFNSALLCGRNITDGKVDDYGKIIIGEPQIYELLRKYEKSDIRIAFMHHPLDWLIECDRKKVESALRKGVHFILCGHQHNGKVEIITGTDGQCIVIPSGASYDRRDYPNAYNYVRLDTRTRSGTVFLRRWSIEESRWECCYKSRHPKGEYAFTIPGFAGDDARRQPVYVSDPGIMYSQDNPIFNVSYRANEGGMVGREYPLLKVREPSVQPLKTKSSKRFVHTQISTEGMIDLVNIPNPYTILYDPTDDQILVDISQAFCYLWLPKERYFRVSQLQSLTPVAAICSVDPWSILNKIKDFIDPQTIQKLKIPPSKLLPEYKEKCFKALSMVLPNCFFAAVTIPDIILGKGHIDTNYAYKVLVNLFLKPLVEMHLHIGMTSFHLRISKVDEKKPYLLGLVKSTLKNYFPKRGATSVQFCEENSSDEIFSNITRLLAWAVGGYYNSNNSKWISMLEIDTIKKGYDSSSMEES